MIVQSHTFTKKEKLCKKSVIDQLIKGNDHYKVLHYPFVCIWKKIELDTHFPAQIMISVGKRNFKKAVVRNQLKRQIREIYRQRKHLLYEHLQTQGKQIALIVFYTGKEPIVQQKMEDSFEKIIDKIIKMD